MLDHLPRELAVGLSGRIRSMPGLGNALVTLRLLRDLCLPRPLQMRHHPAEPTLREAFSEDAAQAMMKADVDPNSISGLADQRKPHLEQHP